MRGSTRDCSPTGSEAIVLDTGAFIAGKAAALPGRLATPPRVLEEVRDRGSRALLELLQSTGRLEVLPPSPRAVERAREEARRAGVLGRLSGADIEVLALALDLAWRGCRVSLATDDYTLQRLAARLGLGVVRLRYRGAV
ncbi:NOB1 family endonuclease [Aeropyrum camini]|uniref:Ribonuclease VapC n=1 Tax=Aeropyrum camini SY1 = JCM 12091 TaxID=1198449 RepID=U3TFU6_9CREN|nr:NOB1 family endonuclease [Aeropyrum camini]BAN90179.1 predicted nucleic acid-binding protein [Aeropyrum camini SY1 = JCM 12091]